MHCKLITTKRKCPCGCGMELDANKIFWPRLVPEGGVGPRVICPNFEKGLQMLERLNTDIPYKMEQLEEERGIEIKVCSESGDILACWWRHPGVLEVRWIAPQGMEISTIERWRDWIGTIPEPKQIPSEWLEAAQWKEREKRKAEEGY